MSCPKNRNIMWNLLLPVCITIAILIISRCSSSARQTTVLPEDTEYKENYDRFFRDLDQKIAENSAEKDSLADQFLKMTREHGDAFGEASIYRLLGYNERTYSKAAEYLFRAQEIFNRNGYTKEAAYLLIDLGEIARANVDYAEALKFLEAAEIELDPLGDIESMARVFNRLAAVYFENGINRPEDKESSLTAAIDYAEKSLEIALKKRDDRLIFSNHNILGAVLTARAEFTDALAHLEEALRIVEQNKWLDTKPNVLNNFAHVYFDTGRYEEAIRYGEESYQLSQVSQTEQYMEVSSILLAKAYAKIGNYQKAYEYSEINSNIRNSFYYNDRNNLILELQTKYDVQQKENSIQLEQSKRKTDQLKMILGAGFILFVIVVVFTRNLQKNNSKIQDQNAVITRQLEEKNSLISEKDKYFRQFKIAAQIANIGIWDFDLKTGKMNWDSRMYQIFQSDEIETDLMRVKKEKMHPDDRDKMSSDLREAIDRKSEYHQLFRIILSGEQIRYIEERAIVQEDSMGEASKIIGVVRDITESRIAEEERLEKEKNRLNSQKMESLGIMAGGIAHDYNNLLTAILGNLDLTLEDQHISSDVRDNITRALIATKRASRLTQQMLAFTGREQLFLEPLNLSDVIHTNEIMLRQLIDTSNILEIQLQKEIPSIMGDKSQVIQMIINLIINSKESMNGRAGKITLKTSVQKLDIDALTGLRTELKIDPGYFICLEIKDSGCGMDSETKTRLFDPFFTTKFTGRGLGLSAVLGIMRCHKGGINVRSEPGRGTCISCFFPVLDTP